MADTVEIKVFTSRFISYWDIFISDNRFQEIFSQNTDLKNVNFNFESCRFMEPFHIVSMACLMEEYFLNGITISIINVNDIELKRYLENVNFLKYWVMRPKDYIPSERKTALALWKISPEMVDGYCIQAKEYFEQNYIDNKDLMPLSTSLSELFMNISDHSKSSVSGFCLTQYYPNLSKIKFSVCDFGIGIPNSINTYLAEKGEKPLPDTECLLKAFEFKFTTQSTPRNRGFGLDNIKTIVKSNRGSLRVVSNKANFRIENSDMQTITQAQNFGGTHFEIILGVENFAEKTAETEDFDFDS